MERREPPIRKPSPPSWSAEIGRLYPAVEKIPRPLVAEVWKRGRAVALPAGAIAFDVDSPCEGLTLVTRGLIRVTRGSPQGREILLYRVGPGESCILSVSCLLGRSSYAARGIVETDVTGAVIPADLFETLVAEAPDFRAFVFGLFGTRIAGLMQLIEEVAFHRLDQRLASLLLIRFQETGASTFEVTHQDLADQLGTVREMISRVLQSFESQGAVALSRGQVSVLQPSVLRGFVSDVSSRSAAIEPDPQ